MGTRKGYPFSRRQYKQGWGILSNTILGLLGLGVCAAKGIKNAVESNASLETNNTQSGEVQNINKENKVKRIKNDNAKDKKIISDNMSDDNFRRLVVDDYIISGEYKSDYSYASLSCLKRESGNPYYTIKIGIMQSTFGYAFKGDLMLIKLNNGEILELNNIVESKPDTRKFGYLITLIYHISEEQITKMSENKVVKIRVALGDKIKNINVSNSDLSKYVLESYLKIMDRLSKKPSIYDGF